MSIIRTEHNKSNPYVMLSKSILEDPKLSWASKGLWSYLMSRPDNWTISVSHLKKIYEGKGGGEKAIYNLLNELIDCGYCQRNQIRDEKGLFTKCEYVITEFKNKLPDSLQRDADERNPVSGGTNNKGSLINKEKEPFPSSFLSPIHEIFSQIPNLTPEQQQSVLDTYPLDRIQETIDYVKSKPRDNEASYFMKMIPIERKKDNPDKEKIISFLKEMENKYSIRIAIYKKHCVLPGGNKVFFDLKGNEFRKQVRAFLDENYQSC